MFDDCLKERCYTQRVTRLLAGVLLFIAAGYSQVYGRRSIQYSDIPPDLREALGAGGGSEQAFDVLLRSFEQKTAQRERLGQMDQLIFFLLQSETFTSQPRIEPALSARTMVESLSAPERERYLRGELDSSPPLRLIPGGVAARIRDLTRALRSRGGDERLAWCQDLLGPENVESTLSAEYFRAMRFLYEKEFLSKRFEGDRRRAEVAELYQTRGLSTDSRADAGLAVWKALAFLKQESPATRLDRVLIVGPGLDSAPRTDLTDLPPESSQPFALADAILQLGLSAPATLSIHCVDISAQVVGFLQEFSSRPLSRVTFLSRRGTSEYQAYFRSLGNALGHEVPPNPNWKLPQSVQAKTIEVQRGIARGITASRMNILTETGAPRFDLVVATNVFVYFDRPELLLALAGIHSLLRDGGYLIHNEIRDDIDNFSRGLGMPPLDARRIPLFENERRVVLDGFVLHRKDSR
jgi:hypothetical protein